MDTAFSPNGTTGSMVFTNQANIRIGNFTYVNGWDVDDYSLTLSEFRSGTNYQARTSYNGDTLALYRSGLTRLTCDRTVVENYPFTLYGESEAQTYREMWNAFIGASTPKALLRFSPQDENGNPTNGPATALPQLQGDEVLSLIHI